MNRGKILFDKREVETQSLSRPIMVHTLMHYQCVVCENIYNFWLEKGLEDKIQDEIEPDKHKPVPFTIPCLCGGTAKHVAWGSDVRLDEYVPLCENDNYFENIESEDCGIPHFRNEGFQVLEDKPKYPELSEIVDAFESKSSKEKHMDEDFDDNPYGLAHVSTTTLKAELRRRKQSWNRRYRNDREGSN